MKVRIAKELWDKIFLYTKYCDIEISGYGEIELRDKELVITELHVPSQVCAGTETEISDAELAKLASKVEHPENLKLHWHSHVNMGCFISGDDQGIINSFGTDWMVMLITNKKGEYFCVIHTKVPVPMQAKAEVEVVEDNNLIKEIKAEIKKKVKVRKSNFNIPINKKKENKWGNDCEIYPLEEDILICDVCKNEVAWYDATEMDTGMYLCDECYDTYLLKGMNDGLS